MFSARKPTTTAFGLCAVALLCLVQLGLTAHLAFDHHHGPHHQTLDYGRHDDGHHHAHHHHDHGMPHHHDQQAKTQQPSPNDWFAPVRHHHHSAAEHRLVSVRSEKPLRLFPVLAAQQVVTNNLEVYQAVGSSMPERAPPDFGVFAPKNPRAPPVFLI